MSSEYDIFERTPGGYLVWRDVVSGYENATRRLGELASQSNNELFLFHLASKKVVARVNEPLDRNDSRPCSGTDERDVMTTLGRNNRSAA